MSQKPQENVLTQAICATQENASALTTQQLLARAKAEITEWDVLTVHKELQGKTMLLLDVREPEELCQGRFHGAIHVPRGMLEFKVDPTYPNAEKQLLDKSAPLLIYCKTGGRSALAAHTLKVMGYQTVVSMAGGIEAWKAASLTLATA